jgi:hypothetical protein
MGRKGEIGCHWSDTRPCEWQTSARRSMVRPGPFFFKRVEACLDKRWFRHLPAQRAGTFGSRGRQATESRPRGILRPEGPAHHGRRRCHGPWSTNGILCRPFRPQRWCGSSTVACRPRLPNVVGPIGPPAVPFDVFRPKRLRCYQIMTARQSRVCHTHGNGHIRVPTVKYRRC